jgi:hypothetical protein
VQFQFILFFVSSQIRFRFQDAKNNLTLILRRYNIAYHFPFLFCASLLHLDASVISFIRYFTSEVFHFVYLSEERFPEIVRFSYKIYMMGNVLTEHSDCAPALSETFINVSCVSLLTNYDPSKYIYFKLCCLDSRLNFRFNNIE